MSLAELRALVRANPVIALSREERMLKGRRRNLMKRRRKVMADEKTLKEKIAEIENDDPVREIFEDILALIEELEAKINAPPIRQGKK